MLTARPEPPMTRRMARALYRQTYGYFSPGAAWDHTQDYLICPLCRKHVVLARGYPRCYRPATTAELRTALEVHLLHADTDVRCGQVATIRPGSERT